MKGIRITKKEANNVRKKLLKEDILSKKFKARNDENYVYFPIKTECDDTTIESLLNEYPYEYGDYEFEKASYRPQNFRDYLEDIPEQLVDEVTKSFDVIGDIVIIEVPPELETKKHQIAQAVLKFTRRKSVYCKKSKVSGVRRTRKLEYLSGEESLETTHREFGLRYRLNPSTVYFSPRLATERSRITSQVNNGEIIIDFFAGIASFGINIAKKHDVTIYSVDINPEAIRYAHENIKLNNLVGNVIPILGDINDVIVDLPMADRILMNLPGYSKNFLNLAVNHLKKGGIINYYEFSNSEETVINRIREASGTRKVEIEDVRRVRSQSPGIYHMGVDARIY